MSEKTGGHAHNFMRMPKIPDEDLFADTTKLEQDANEEDKLREQLTRRLTPQGKAFIIRQIIRGYTNKEINRLLRKYKYLSPTSPGLTDQTFRTVRRGKYAKRDPELLEAEAQFIAHKSLSKAIYYYSDILDHSYQRVIDGIECDENGVQLSPDGLIYAAETKLSEVRSIMADATKLLYSWYAKEIAKYTDSIGDDSKGLVAADTQISQIDAVMASMMQEHLARKRRQLVALGLNPPTFEELEAEASRVNTQAETVDLPDGD